VRRSGETRRAKLFYLRKRVGKAVRLSEQRKVIREEAPAAPKSSAKKETEELAAAAS